MIKENNDVYKQPGSPYSPGDEPLSAEDAIRAMLEGETLHDEDGNKYAWRNEHGEFCRFEIGETPDPVCNFNGLYRRPVKRTRLMTRWEMMAWANSEESRGWVVRKLKAGPLPQQGWRVPQFFNYESDLADYRRARLLPDLSGVDKDTIQGFEVEGEND